VKPRRAGIFDPWRSGVPVPEKPKEELVDALENEGRDEVTDDRVAYMFRGRKTGITIQVPRVGESIAAEAVSILLDALEASPHRVLKKYSISSEPSGGLNRVTLAYKERRMFVDAPDASVSLAIDNIALALIEAELDPLMEKKYQQFGVVPWRLA
jgi:hypothetical protein